MSAAAALSPAHVLNLCQSFALAFLICYDSAPSVDKAAPMLYYVYW